MPGLLSILQRALEHRWPEGSYVQQIQSLKPESPMELPPVRAPKITRHRPRRQVVTRLRRSA
jgi:hypothetical protein